MAAGNAKPRAKSPAPTPPLAKPTCAPLLPTRCSPPSPHSHSPNPSTPAVLYVTPLSCGLNPKLAWQSLHLLETEVLPHLPRNG